MGHQEQKKAYVGVLRVGNGERKTKLNEVDPDFAAKFSGSSPEEIADMAAAQKAAKGAFGNLSFGDTSDEIVARKAASQQRNLRRVGLKNITQLQAKVGAEQTGEYDAQTMTAVQKLQRKLGVEDDHLRDVTDDGDGRG